MAKGVTRDAIVEAAFAVLDAEGIDGLTVRAVADRLAIKAPALYWHVRDKQALLDEMGTRVWRDIAAAGEPVGEWRAVLAAYARAARAGLLAHRDGARTFSGTYLTDDAVLRRQEEYLAWMEAQGFGVDAATDAFGIVTAFVVGHCIEEQGRAQAPDDRYALERRDARLDAAVRPRSAASGRRMFAADADTRFDTLVAVLLDGIAGRQRPGPAQGPGGGDVSRGR